MYYPKITLVTPSYNQGAFIERTIASVLEQNYPNLELIIIDGGSTDNTVDIIKKHNKYISYWVSEPDKGQSHAINKGLQKASGEIFNWLNSDDYLEKGSLSEIANLFLAPSISLVAGKCRKFTPDGLVRIIPEEFKHQTIEDKILIPLYMQPSTFIRMDCVRKMGLVNEHLHYCMDYEWILRYLLLFGVQGILETDFLFSNALLHNESKTAMSTAKFKKETINIYYYLARQLQLNDSLLDNFKQTGFISNSYQLSWNIESTFKKEPLGNSLQNFISPYIKDHSYIYRESADYYTFFNQKSAAFESALKALITNPLNFLNYKYVLSEVYKRIFNNY